LIGGDGSQFGEIGPQVLQGFLQKLVDRVTLFHRQASAMAWNQIRTKIQILQFTNISSLLSNLGNFTVLGKVKSSPENRIYISVFAQSTMFSIYFVLPEPSQ
jgi:hypothetical protein